MSKKHMHVIPNQKDGWSVRRAGAEKASKNFESRKDAVNYAKNQAKKEGGELYIHGRDGRILGRDSYSYDPFPPKNKR